MGKGLGALAHTRRQLDFLGVNYYTRALVYWQPKGMAWLVGSDWPHPMAPHRDAFPTSAGRSGQTACTISSCALPRLGLPLLVTENGIATTDETLRCRFLEEHLAAVAAAMAAGAPVIGYLWWSLIDNFEWDSGFAPRFGLFETDYETFARRPRPAAFRFAAIATSRQLTLDASAPIASAS